LSNAEYPDKIPHGGVTQSYFARKIDAAGHTGA